MRFFRSIFFRFLLTLSLIGFFPSVVRSGEYTEQLETVLSYLDDLELYIDSMSDNSDSIRQYILVLKNSIGNMAGTSFLAILPLLNAYYSEVGPTLQKQVITEFLQFLSTNPGVMLTSIDSQLTYIRSGVLDIDTKCADILSAITLIPPTLTNIDNTTVDILEALQALKSSFGSFKDNWESQANEERSWHAETSSYQGQIEAQLESINLTINDINEDLHRFVEYYLDPDISSKRENLFQQFSEFTGSSFSFSFKQANLTSDGSPAIASNSFPLAERTLEGDTFFQYVGAALKLQLEQQANANNYLYNILAQIQSVEKNQAEIDSAVASASSEAQEMQSQYQIVASNSPSVSFVFPGVQHTYTPPSFDPTHTLPTELYFELPGFPLPGFESSTEVHIPINNISNFIENVRICFKFIWWLLVVLINIVCYKLISKLVSWVVSFYGSMTLTAH